MLRMLFCAHLQKFTEVYLRRGKDNLSQKKSMECSRNLDLETLIARDSWASVEEMEMVIPFHAPNFKRICEKSVGNADKCSISELAFTRFVATFLFLRVKCARPMTFQYITLEMVEVARTNGGFIDQTQFKTAALVPARSIPSQNKRIITLRNNVEMRFVNFNSNVLWFCY